MTTGEPNWDDIRIFLAVARSGSLTEAARRLGLSQPTIGRHLRSLENLAGARLFDRLPNRLELTARGRALLQAAGGMEEGAGALLRELHQAAAAEAEPVQVTATSSVSLFLTTHLQALLAESGQAIAVGASRDRANLARREADIALRMRRVPGEGDLAARRIGRIGFALYAARAYLEPRGLTGDGSLAGLDFIGLPEPERTPSQSAWFDAVAAQGVLRCRLGEVHLRHRAAADGLGVALLPLLPWRCRRPAAAPRRPGAGAGRGHLSDAAWRPAPRRRRPRRGRGPGRPVPAPAPRPVRGGRRIPGGNFRSVSIRYRFVRFMLRIAQELPDIPFLLITPI